jgi:spore germination protein KA
MPKIEMCLKENIENLKNTFHDTSDLIVRKIKSGCEGTHEMNIVYLDGIIDTDVIQDFVVKPLLEAFKADGVNETPIDQIMERIVESADVKITTQYKELTHAIVQGKYSHTD